MKNWAFSVRMVDRVALAEIICYNVDNLIKVHKLTFNHGHYAKKSEPRPAQANDFEC